MKEVQNKKLEAMKAVYCYHFPEVREVLHEVERFLPDEMYLVTTPVEYVEDRIINLFDPPLEIPATESGHVDLDMIHEPILSRIIAAYSSTVPDLGSFPYRYPTSGSSEGIFHILAKLRTDGTTEINTLEGEYEGYAAQAQNLGMSVKAFDAGSLNASGIRPGVWFVSDPSARDGNVLPDGFVHNLCEAGHKVILDLAYAGLTSPRVFNVDHENIPAAVMSFSKPYGVFRQRLGGLAFSREGIATLYGNKWFKDVPGLFQALRIAEYIGPERLYRKYMPVQKAIVDGINRDFSLGMRPSDSLLLGYMGESDTEPLDAYQLNMIAPFRRGRVYRFCLTPYFERRERGELI